MASPPTTTNSFKIKALAKTFLSILQQAQKLMSILDHTPQVPLVLFLVKKNSFKLPRPTQNQALNYC